LQLLLLEPCGAVSLLLLLLLSVRCFAIGGGKPLADCVEADVCNITV
jgi:hypothetical protein